MMSYAEKPNYDQYNKCDHLINQFAYLSVLESALIWCGIPKDEIAEHAKMCKPKGDSNGLSRNTFVHPFISCVEPRCRILHEAFNNGLLKMGRDGKEGDYVEYTRHIAYDRRTIIINDLKEYIQEFHPNDMPKTLFSTVEINKAQPISNDDYIKLIAKLDALEAENKDLNQRLDKARSIYKEQKQELDFYRNSKQNELSDNTEQSYLATIGLLLELCQKKSFSSQSQIINTIIDYNIQGQGQRTLQDRFAKANQILAQAMKK